jgi:hypothetical protein
MRNILIVISTVLVLLSPLVYIRSIVRGQTRPHRTTRLVLLLICILSTLALFDSHYSAAFWLSAASLVQAILVFVLSLYRGYGGYSKLDIVCLVIAVSGLIWWQVTDRPLVGLMAAITADMVGAIPMLVKTYKLPHTENWQFFAMDTFSGMLSLLALTSYTIYTASYPVYIVLINGLTAYFIVWRKRVLRIK